MNISPRRRSRILKAHELRQNGDSLRSIATALNISQATLLADLRLLETDWSEVADALADDLLLELLTLLQARLHRLTSAGPPLPLEHIAGGGDHGAESPVVEERPAARDVTRLLASHDNAIAATLHEIRQTIREIERAARGPLASTNPHSDSGDDQLTDAPPTGAFR